MEEGGRAKIVGEIEAIIWAQHKVNVSCIGFTFDL